jgi:AraC-like DNA-binding protein
MNDKEKVQHIEFFHRDHFYHNYHRQKATGALSKYIDFFWETDFDDLWQKYPNGFSDLLFPNVGYTYLINLGTPFIMQIDDEAFDMKADGFLPRYKNISCHHSIGNKIFGIKFTVSPIVFQKKINFAEYTEYIYPLAYLVDRTVATAVKDANSFAQRVSIVSHHYSKMIDEHKGSLKHVDVVTEILANSSKDNYTTAVETLAEKYQITTRTLQRYFESTTSTSCKQALQILRIRKAISAFITNPETFRHEEFGYFDYSHFHKHMKQFLTQHKLANIQSHTQLLEGSGIINY